MLVFILQRSDANGAIHFPDQVLGISLLAMLSVQTTMRLGQLSISPALGRMTDRIGNKSVMLFCLVLTAQGPLFYFFSTPQAPWWFVARGLCGSPTPG